MDNRNITVIRIPIPFKQFFRVWCEFLKPLHNLTSREMDLAAAILEERFKLSKSITNPELLDDVLMSEESKRRIRKNSGISVAHFQVIMAKLRDSKVIIDGRLNPKFIPNLKDDPTNYKLLFSFDLNDS